MDKKIKVLIVDDSETMRKLISMITSQMGYSALEAKDGEEGLKVLAANPDVSLITTDINMPVLNGLGFTERVRKSNQEIPILMVTTESEDKLRRRGMELGASGWLVKPFRPNALMGMIQTVLQVQ